MQHMKLWIPKDLDPKRFEKKPTRKTLQGYIVECVSELGCTLTIQQVQKLLIAKGSPYHPNNTYKHLNMLADRGKLERIAKGVYRKLDS